MCHTFCFFPLRRWFLHFLYLLEIKWPFIRIKYKQIESLIGKVAFNKNLGRLFIETNAQNVSLLITSYPNG